MLLVRSRSNYRVQALPSIKADRSWNLSRIASVHSFVFVLFAHTLRTRRAFSHASVDHRFVFCFFLRFLSFPSLFSSPSYSDDIEIYDIKDLLRNNFVHVFLIREEVALSYGRNFNFRNELLHSVA